MRFDRAAETASGADDEDPDMPPLTEGQRIPEVTFRVRRDGDWADLTSRELFADRSVVLFALPGAFTPTCSDKHLSRFNQLAPAIRVHGVDEVICLSVNDACVMDAWRETQGVTEVRLIPDGNGEFTRGMGMLVDRRANGFGERSRRYAMLVRDGVIEKLLLEELRPDGTETYGVSDADSMLAHLASLSPRAKPPT